MKALIFPLILALLGLGAGAGAGVFLKPDLEGPNMADCGEKSPEPAEDTDEAEEDPNREYVKLNNQFIVPVVEDGLVASMVVLSLTLEAQPGGREVIYGREPKIRDAFLQVLFDHANAGGFSGNFTKDSKMETLSNALNSVANDMLDGIITDVFITDIVRQDT